LHCVDVGSWWSAGHEIDVVCVDENRIITLVGSCKWTQQPMDVKHYAELRQALDNAPTSVPQPYFALFSRTGFTPRLKELAADSERVWLVDLDRIYSG
jgi:hypothetical protein